MVGVTFIQTVQQFCNGPLRPGGPLKVTGSGDYVFGWSWETVTCHDSEEFARRMNMVVVDSIRFGKSGNGDLVMDKSLHDALLPFKASWRNGCASTPTAFASSELFVTAMSDLFVCKGLLIGVKQPQRLRLEVPLLSLEASKACRDLDLLDIDPESRPGVSELVEWLHLENRFGSERKQLNLVTADFVPVEELIALLKRKFMDAKEPQSYYVSLCYDDWNTDLTEKTENEDTSERLAVDCKLNNPGNNYIIIERNSITI